MEFNQLRSFLMIARLGSFTRAAETLFLTQPALSLQIKSLEKSLGEPLFERRGRTLLLTSAGQILQRQARGILDQVEQAGEEIAALKGLAGGRLVIGTNDSYCLYLLPDLVQYFRDQYPAVELRLTNSHSTQVIAWVVEGRVDFGLITLPVTDADITTHSLFQREDVLVCTPDHPLSAQDVVTAEELVTHPLLLLDKGSVSRVLLDQALADAGLFPQIVMEVGSVEVIKRYVEIGLGVSIIPRFSVEDEIQAGRLHAARLDWLPACSVGVVQRCGGYLSPAGRAFLDLLEGGIVL